MSSRLVFGTSEASEVDESETIDRDGAVRWRVDEEQLKILEAAFKNEMYPSGEMRRALAGQLGVNPRQCQVWFQNRRQREQVRLNRGSRSRSSAPLKRISVPLAAFKGTIRGGSSALHAVQASMAQGFANVGAALQTATPIPQQKSIPLVAGTCITDASGRPTCYTVGMPVAMAREIPQMAAPGIVQPTAISMPAASVKQGSQGAPHPCSFCPIGGAMIRHATSYVQSVPQLEVPRSYAPLETVQPPLLPRTMQPHPQQAVALRSNAKPVVAEWMPTMSYPPRSASVPAMVSSAPSSTSLLTADATMPGTRTLPPGMHPAVAVPGLQGHAATPGHTG